jgi:transposase
MQYQNDSRRCLTVLDQDSTLIAVIEMSLSSWLVAGIVPDIERQKLSLETSTVRFFYTAINLSLM